MPVGKVIEIEDITIFSAQNGAGDVQIKKHIIVKSIHIHRFARNSKHMYDHIIFI